ncbi:hypothetical protein [Niabella aurantiaca]|uniref:hypothetical protein n=1 Tax=Niabella aurantiaca TaxID=379900 RepID=UPI000376E87F|nr:hypothetical protein [Niabella aurantiaca]
MAPKQLIKDTLKQSRLHKTILLMLVALWVVSLTLILCLVINWQRQQHSAHGRNAHRHPSLDEMLLSFRELKLGNNTTLINLQLREVSQKKASKDTADEEVIADYRKKIYDQMLEQKIRARPPAKQDGFTIKPVPQ